MEYAKSKTIFGNKNGISRYVLQQLAALYDDRAADTSMASYETVAVMAAVTAKIKREVAVYLNRQGQVVFVAVGDCRNVSLPDLGRRRGEHRLSGIRCIHTHPSDNGALSQMDLSALEQLQLDAMVAIGVDSDGGVTNIGLAWGGALTDNSSFLYNSWADFAVVDFRGYLTEIEESLSAVTGYQTEAGQERALLVAVQTETEDEVSYAYSVAELAELAKTAGVEVIGMVRQRCRHAVAATYVGRGKLEEIKQILQNNPAEVVIFNDDLSPVQQRNLEAAIGCKIIDRSSLILDIFAQRAQSNEGKIQVELAQLKYALPRLQGQGLALSRLGGGIGTRGPGETKLETDKRAIKRKIRDLEARLQEIVKTRNLHRQRRNKQNIPLVALVGYTNVGKSSLLNVLTDAAVMVENQLFATLDTTTRLLPLPSGKECLLTDTVGFIRKLPHHLIAAFRATLEESLDADLLLHVVDGASEGVEGQAEVVLGLLKELGVADKKILTVVNKIDLLPEEQGLARLLTIFPESMAISVLEKQGLEALLAKIEAMLSLQTVAFSVCVPFQAGALLDEIHRYGTVNSLEYTAEGTKISGTMEKAYWQKISSQLEPIEPIELK
ncbi:MAG: GTPase HflX [Peptococcaceae bacterium]|jgi:GTP-binding protein HflX|nr:GTPase HflX [Peptococcaceae bacterium]